MQKSLLAITCAIAAPAFAASCESLSSLALPDTAITAAQIVQAGQFVQPGPAAKGKGANVYKELPDFCRVAATLKPSSDSDIRIEVWLPMANWNRKLQAVGNGGWAGVISYSALAEALKAGYASVSTDTGHVGGSGSFALEHPEKLTDFSWRSEHEMTLKAKALIQAFYGSAPKLSYWNGCSTGGRQGLKEAQKFPDDYDGIIAGAPANRTAISLWIASAVLKDPASYIPPAKYPVIHQAALAACDLRDGVKDGLIDDPTKCKFDPKVLLCKNGDGPACLTAPQVDAAKKIYSSATNPRTGAVLFSSLVPGSELGWGVQAAGPDPSANIYDHFKYVVFKNPAWDWRTFDFDKGIALAEQPENAAMNATDPNLKAFFAHNGKLLIYHGWADTNVPPVNTIKYYGSVLDTLGGASKTSNHVRLFMEPGMGHCGGGEGPNVFDKVGTLERWVEQGKAPEKIIASHSTEAKVDRTRPLCPYPQVAKYKGSGSIDEAANFACQVP
ncbi:MAG TPA: tannase/feruloyl esterase family alpha/beta hydrolase [Bryobacteraceae bacterium]|nr:tannase/feruloyl esterase family alpha/beta hydrolase [Bryobacteraceae bacterium]